ncbi:MAG: TRM11 family SAM-dependent methyltransferase [Mycobacteriales bacterium]
MPARARSQPDTGVRFFALTVPGLGALAADELAGISGVTVTAHGNDGRADVVLLALRPDTTRASAPRLLGCRTVEDVFVEVGRTLRGEGDRPQWIAGRLWRAGRVRRALAAWAGVTHASTARATYRVIVRVQQERSFARTELRRAMDRAVGQSQPGWRAGDPAKAEVWTLEYGNGMFVAGLRISDLSMRQRGGRESERSGALRPAAAAAMVRLAGTPHGELLDPCCGSGTILAEALDVGWRARGIDIDADAVRAATRNAPRAEVALGDSRRIELEDATLGAVVSNLPFGQQYAVQGDPGEWLGTVLAEFARITDDGGSVVLLAPTLPRDRIPSALQLRGRHRIRLLGASAAIWALTRRPR